MTQLGHWNHYSIPWSVAVAREHQQNRRENKSSRTSIFGKVICQLQLIGIGK